MPHPNWPVAFAKLTVLDGMLEGFQLDQLAVTRICGVLRVTVPALPDYAVTQALQDLVVRECKELGIE